MIDIFVEQLPHKLKVVGLNPIQGGKKVFSEKKFNSLRTIYFYHCPGWDLIPRPSTYKAAAPATSYSKWLNLAAIQVN